jgi:hypothetical protein
MPQRRYNAVMKISLCLLLFAAGAYAQTSHLTLDLMALGRNETDAIPRYQRDIMEFEIEIYRSGAQLTGSDPRNISGFFSQDQARKIAGALAGKDLTEAGVRPLAEAIVGMVESAVACRITTSALRESPRFRAAAEQARTALQMLGVDDRNAAAVLDALLTKSNAVAETPSLEIEYR